MDQGELPGVRRPPSGRGGEGRSAPGGANAASAYFGGTADSTVSAIIEKCEKYKGEALTHTFDKALNDTGLGKAFTEATLKLDYAPAFIFTLEDGFEGTVTVTYGPNVHTFEVGADDATIIEIEGMKVYNFAENLTVTAEGKIGEDEISISGSYNLDTYISYHIANASDENTETKSSSEALLALLYALYDYVVIADNYN